MNETAIFAFIVMPVLVVVGAWLAALAHERALRRARGQEKH
jgi:hypothetical protein